MEVNARHVYQASVDKVFRSFGTEADVIAKHESLGARNVEFDYCYLKEASLDLKVHREVPAEAPAMLKKFMAEWNEVYQTENWTGTPGERYQGDFEVHLKGVPVKILGRCVLTQDGDHTVNQVSVKIDCGIPLVGKKLEAFVAESCEASMEKEYQFIKGLVEA